MLRRILGVGFLLFVLTSNAEAFDGLRRGFVLGGGLGIAANASWQADFPFAPDAGENNAGLGAEFLIGYAWNEQNMIVFESNSVGYSTDVGTLKDITVGQGFGGAAWYHYFGDMGGSFFTVLGLGAYVFRWDFESVGVSGKNDPGPGVLIGAGFEFSDHIQAGVYIGSGTTKEPETRIDFEHGHINVLITAVAF